MKYVSLVFFAIALIWSWNVVHKDPAISFQTHSGIQEKLAVFILDTIKAKLPTATDVLIEKVWTEPIAPNQVRAHFVYSFKETSESGVVNSRINGQGLLERQEDDGSGNDRWQLTQVQTTNDAIVFDEATLVTPNGAEGDSTSGAEGDSTSGAEGEATEPTTEAAPATGN